MVQADGISPNHHHLSLFFVKEMAGKKVPFLPMPDVYQSAVERASSGDRGM